MTLPRASTRTLLLLAVLLLALAGCATTTATPVAAPTTPAAEAPDGSDAPDEAPTDEAPPTPVETAPIVASWDHAAAPVDLGDGLVLRRCEGDAPLLCLEDAGGVVGTLEAMHYPAPEAMRGLDGDALDAALRAHAEAYVADFAADRAAGCGPDHEVLGDAPGSLTVAGGPGLRYGFATVVDDAVVEHVVTWATVRDDELHLVVTASVADGTCMADEGAVLDPVRLGELLPVLDRVLAGTPLSEV